MSLARSLGIAAFASILGVAVGAVGGVFGAMESVAPAATPPIALPTTTPTTIGCGELETMHRPLYQLPTAPIPTTGRRPPPPGDPDVNRDADERTCTAQPTCILFPEGSLLDRATPTKALDGERFGVLLGASRFVGGRSATIRIAGSADGLGVPPFMSEASIHEGDVVPTLGGPVTIVAIRAHDPRTYVVARFVDARPVGRVEPMRFFLGPAIGAFVADYTLSFSWSRGAAHLAARHVDARDNVAIEPPIEGNVTDTITLGHYRYHIVATHPPSGRSEGWIEVDARPDAL